MIIRILGEGQYRAPETLCDELNLIDNKIVSQVTEEKADEFRKELAKLISEIKEKGQAIEAKETLKSNIIVPPEDRSFEEVKAVFKGFGIFKD